MEIARQQSDSEFLSLAIRSLKEAKDSSSMSLPFVSLLLAKAEASLGSESKWEKNLIEEWSSWPPGLIFYPFVIQFCFIQLSLDCG